VSTTSDPDNVLWRARYHSKQSRGQVFVTVINIRARRRPDLPVFHAVDEMKHYGVPDPYERNYAFYENEYLCPWTISQEVIVGTWAGDGTHDKRSGSRLWNQPLTQVDPG